MKVYTKVVIDIESNEVVCEESYEYSGKVALCGSSGGGGSGRVDYPDYMKDQHELWLDAMALDITAARTGGSPFAAEAAYDPAARILNMDTAISGFSTSVGALDNTLDWSTALAYGLTTSDNLLPPYEPAAVITAMEANIVQINTLILSFKTLIETLSHDVDWKTTLQYAITQVDLYLSPYAPAAVIADMETSIAGLDTDVTYFEDLVKAMAFQSDWETAVDTVKAKLDAVVFDDAYITADIAAFQNVLDDDITNKILPDFQSGLRDVNAVYTSAFIMGEALINAMKGRDVAKYGTEVRMKFNLQRNEAIKTAAERIVSDFHKQIDFHRAVMLARVDSRRLELEKCNAELKLNEQSLEMIKIGVERMLANLDKEMEFQKSILQAQMDKHKLELEVSNAELKVNEQSLTMIKLGVDHMMKNLFEKIRLLHAYVQLNSDAMRGGITASKEEVDQDLLILDMDARWDMDVFQYGANLLAGIGSGTVASGNAGMSKTQSALSGAMSGAAAGAGGGGPGMIAGGIIGGIGGLLG